MSDLVQEVGVGPESGGRERIGVVERNTTETKISLRLNVDGQGSYTVSTGIRFFDHMLELFTRHGGFDLQLKCIGDLDVDQHHTTSALRWGRRSPKRLETRRVFCGRGTS
jgi:imidazoleglycerol-phosphate dehydratase